jgi:hypothetical protein
LQGFDLVEGLLMRRHGDPLSLFTRSIRDR